ncbi:ATP5S synthase, partial [Cisticola juncidis]|nr:ATP5S synthase [Cisticola juncidis]
RAFWGWLNAVFNKVDHERIQAVGPDRAASEWLLRCGALVRYQGSPKWQRDYNGLPTGPRGRYRIEAISATDACIMYRGFDYLDAVNHCVVVGFHYYILTYANYSLQFWYNITCNHFKLFLTLCTLSAFVANALAVCNLHILVNLEYLYLSDLPGIREKEKTFRILQQALPNLELELDLE